MMRPKAVVVSAFAVHPEMPSEPGVGWQFLQSTARHARVNGHTVILLTNARSAEAIALALDQYGLNGTVEIVAVHIPFSPRFFRWHNPKFTRVEHLIWSILSRSAVKRIETLYDVAYAHHVTFATELLPPPIVFFEPSVLKIWGPIGAGGVAEVFEIPPQSYQMRKQAIMQRIRDRMIELPARAAAARVDLVLAQNSALVKLLMNTSTEVRVFPNVIVPQIAQNRSTRLEKSEENSASLKILQVGHLIPRKRNDLGIYALADPQLIDAELHIVGLPLTRTNRSLETLAKKLGVFDRVHFYGSLDRLDVLQLMNSMSVLLHSSGREGASGVVGEATTVGLPVVCFEGTGAASVLAESGSSGISLSVESGTRTGDIATAIREAERLPRKRSDLWSVGRIDRLVETLHRDACSQRIEGLL